MGPSSVWTPSARISSASCARQGRSFLSLSLISVCDFGIHDFDPCGTGWPWTISEISRILPSPSVWTMASCSRTLALSILLLPLVLLDQAAQARVLAPHPSHDRHGLVPHQAHAAKRAQARAGRALRRDAPLVKLRLDRLDHDRRVRLLIEDAADVGHQPLPSAWAVGGVSRIASNSYMRS